VVTVNDYLAQRDAAWMGQIFEFLGLTVGCIVHGITDEDRQRAYNSDITYATNNELGFDYLRDNMKFRLEDMVQREFNFAIVDEVDSILVDEARTPLIISGPTDDNSELYTAINKLMPKLADDDFELDEKNKGASFTEKGTETLENLLREANLLTEGNLYDITNISLVHHANQALRAHKVFELDTDYIVKDGKVVIIDEFTGRMMEGRRYSEGQHQALEAKEGVNIENENQTLASITFQNYFRLYPKLAGMTGTAMTEASEFDEIYSLQVIEIPTNQDCIRIDNDDEVYRTTAEKDEAIVKLVSDCQKRQQPVLVGTVSIERSEQLSTLLKKNKVKHHVLNARYHEQEAGIVSQAGAPGAVTIATNMAGRGTDIQMGGNLDMRITQEAEHLEGAEKEKKIEEIKAEIAGYREIVMKAGGLYVVGTERHESRRIDNQLRGRSGRQGDPGTSSFFLSLDDDLMRIFGSERMDGMLQKLGLEEGEAIVHPWVNKALEKAQQKVEARNFEIRKNLLKFDDVMNDQRKVIFEQRKELMAEEEVSETIEEMRDDVIDNIVHTCIPEKAYAEQWNIQGLHEETLRIFGLDLPFADWAKEEGIAETEIHERLTAAVKDKMAKKAIDTGPEMMRSVEKSILLQLLDQIWKEHLLALDHLRQGIGLRAYAQKDPLNEYKREAFSLFDIMLDDLRERVTTLLAHVEFQAEEEVPEYQGNNQVTHEGHEDPAFAESAEEYGSAAAVPIKTRKGADERDPNDPSTWGKIARNEPCPCGTGKKYKHCHGRLA
ncbi:MAG: preprotein translocase subunit SecA, partial [Rhodospirillales bacterium]|nr:preprotein translocase subunit SecA [Rhodospirillales bacterium]